MPVSPLQQDVKQQAWLTLDEARGETAEILQHLQQFCLQKLQELYVDA